MEKGDEKALDRAHELRRLLEDDVQAALKALVSEERRRSLGILETSLRSFFSNFDKVEQERTRLGLTHDKGLHGSLRESTHEVEKALQSVPALTILMLQMRRHEKNFLLRGEDKYMKEMEERGDEFTKVLAAATLPAAITSRIKILITSYQRDFKALVSTWTTMKQIDETMTSQAAEIAKLMNETVASQKKDLKTRLADTRRDIAAVGTTALTTSATP